MYPFDKPIKSLHFRSFFVSICSRVFISRSNENRSIVTCESLATFFLDREIESATVPRIIASGTNQVVVDGRKIVQHTIGGNVTILEGRDLLLRCPIEGFPVPSISWLFNGLPVQISDTLQIDETTGNLKVVEMTPEDDGVYTCVATNIAGEAREASFTTVVGEF